MDEVSMPKAAFEALMEQVATLQATVERLTTLLEKKDQIIRNLNRARFGQSSEKRTYLLSDGQLSFFDQIGDGDKKEAIDIQDKPHSDEKKVQIKAHARKPKRTMEELCANIPEEIILLDLPEEQKRTADGRELKCIGTDYVRTELVREPSRIYKLTYRCNVYADPKAESDTGKADIRRAKAPTPLIPHSYASASVVTDIIVKKYADALPLYRQEQIWKREGVELRRNTMANWIIQTAETYLKPFSDALLKELLQQTVIHADETVLQVNKEPGRAATAESRIWAYASSKRAERQVRYFRYEDSRRGECADKVLGNYAGLLITDGYKGYNGLKKATRAGCWAHARRKWVEAMPAGAAKETSQAAVGLEYCSRLFAIEQQLEKKSAEERREERQKHSKPIVDAYYSWLSTILRPSGKLKTAITYSLNQREYLCAFLEHGEIEISNNQVENAIRPIVVGRKNWLFCDTQAGANASVIIYTLLETAKANGLNPEAYLYELLSVLPQRFVDNPASGIDDLLPWSQEIISRFMV